jgi:OmpA-OmpF porin, OOP family
MKIKWLAALLFLSFQLSNTLTAQETDSLTKVYSRYDFIPGEKILFFDDFSQENIGDFPSLWNTNGSGEVVTYGKYPGKWFKITNNRSITTLLDPLTLPENYTIEFDIVPQKDPANNNAFSNIFYLISTIKPKDLMYGVARPGGTGVKLEFGYNQYISAYFSDGTPDVKNINQDATIRQQPDTKYRISISVQKQRIRVYKDEVKIFDLARAISDKFKYNMIRFGGGVPLIGNVRIATGFPDMRNKLITEGKLVSYGIYFDVNSDKLKPQSAGTLKEISTIMTENPDLRIEIVGYTDSDGDDASNLDLSKRRAASVKNALSTSYGIDAARIETDGKGEKEPVAPNTNGTNKALNRRVEFIKL